MMPSPRTETAAGPPESPPPDGLTAQEREARYRALCAALQQREHELARLSRLYSALSHMNQAIVVTPERDALFRKVCQVLVEHGGFHLAWIGWEEPATRRLRPVAVWGDENDYIAHIEVYTDERPEGRGPTGTAFRENRACICNDLLAEPAAQPWRAEMERRGLRASAALPIRCEGRPAGTLNVYADEPGFFRDKETALLAEAAGDLSFALENFAREERRRRAEETVRQERDFSETLIRSLPGVLYLYDEAGRFLRWNENFERVTGYTGAELAAMHPLDFFAGREKERVAARIGEVFTRGESSVEALFRAKDGRETPYYFTGVATDFGGRRCLFGVGIDISARRQAEAARGASEARYRTLFEQAPDGILIAAPGGVYVDANASVCRMLGYTREELVGRAGADIVAPDEAVHLEAALDAITGRRGHHREWRFRRKDGTVFPVEVMATLMPDGNLLAMIRDITERKAAEDALRRSEGELRELNERLEQRVAERTAEMQAAVERAEAADRIKSAFLATMSHELRTPLNSIIGFTGIILQGLAGPLNAEQTKQLGMVRGSARHLLELINDVLDISKIEAEQLTVAAAPFDLAESCARVAATVRPQAQRKGLEFTTVLAPDLGAVTGDRRRVEQILLNLLNNAVKFTDGGRVTLAADALAAHRFAPDAPPVAAVRIRVTDTGIGIRPADLGTLFQPFRQVDSGLARQHEGTGLGLAICRRLATLMGGDVAVASEWGRGSEFTVTLPRQPRPAP